MFRYGYAVTDDQGLDFNQQETSDGGVVTGSYSVVLPDGRIQTVTYSVRPETGFVVSWAAQIHSAGAPCLTAPCCRPRSPTPTWAAAVSPPRPASRTSTGAAASGAARAAAAELRPGTAVR